LLYQQGAVKFLDHPSVGSWRDKLSCFSAVAPVNG
jgi:hypothetical protein